MYIIYVLYIHLFFFLVCLAHVKKIKITFNIQKICNILIQEQQKEETKKETHAQIK